MNGTQRGQWEELFVDTSGFFAMGNSRDNHFDDAQLILRAAASSGTRLVTTTYIVAESHALFLSRSGYARAARFLREIDAGTVSILQPTGEDELAARASIYRYTDKLFSLTDAISFAVMERLGITTALAFDRDFERYGFAMARA